jgi:large subunit ribosomal protein L15
MWTHTVRYTPDRFGKVGFHSHGRQVTTINVGELDQLSENLLLSGQAIQKEEGIFIDLTTFGVNKLLGSGRVEKQLLIRVKSYSKKAVEKIQKTNGQILNVD